MTDRETLLSLAERGLSLVPKDQVPCWPWELRHVEHLPAHPVGERCEECGIDVALPRDLGGRQAVCIYCALDIGLLPQTEIEPADERPIRAQAERKDQAK